MAFHGVVSLPADQWVHLTSAGGVAAGAVTLLGISPNEVWIDVRATATTPTNFATSFPVDRQKGVIGQTLASLCPGVAGAHIYARSAVASDIFVSYA